MKIRGHWRRILAVLIPLAVGLFVATGTGSARRGHEAGPPLTPKPGVEVKHDTSPPLRTIPPKPGQGRKEHLEHKIPVPRGSGTPDPVVVRLSEHKLVESLAGHQATVLGIAFSRDGKRVVTACEDGKVRLWSAPDWKLLETLSGHQGPVHWAEFSPDGAWVASAGEDKTVRIWSAENGKLEQALSESQAPLLTVAFSPNGDYVAASAENTVLVWKRTPP